MNIFFSFVASENLKIYLTGRILREDHLIVMA